MNNSNEIENKNLNDKIKSYIKNETIYKNKLSETDKQIEKYTRIEKKIIQLEEQNKLISKAKEDF
jgi:N-acetylmuramoyl-L-alanine amidase CwlA